MQHSEVKPVFLSSNLPKNLSLVKEKLTSGGSVVVCCARDFERERAQAFFKKEGISNCFAESASQISAKKVNIANLMAEGAFEWKGSVFIPSDKIISKNYTTVMSSRKSNKRAMQELNAVDIGQLVAHRDYGVGVLEGVKIFDLNGQENECLQIRYADGTLYVPVSKMHLITKRERSIDDGPEELDNMGSSNWRKTKLKAENKVAELAEKIISTASKRKLVGVKKYIVSERQGPMDDFCSLFPHTETTGQMEAINDVYLDLESGFVTDRLICGDVGFGKTEVALRAIFLVACGRSVNKHYAQAAFVCPTLFLARQNYGLVKERFERFGVRVAILVGSMSEKERRAVKDGLAVGSVDVVIGTHAVLARDVKFKDLGLIVYDEEQSFGVEQKERLKNLYPSAHFLSLSATPIPRTLQKALSGLQEISAIVTPPKNKLAIKTDIIKFSKEKIKDIIQKEKELNGQTIVITPRIADIDDLIMDFAPIVPEERMLVLHGGQSRPELLSGQEKIGSPGIDMIIATTIIASGMDFGGSNSILINRPEMFGLSQLHQIRGRVGRRAEQAYCYMLVDDRTAADKEKMKKLNALKELNHFGAGFEIANMDLESRGEGSLLGKEQSGKGSVVSGHLYYELLNEAINRIALGKDFERLAVPTVEIDAPIYISMDYISSIKSRIDLYRRMSEIASEDNLSIFKSEVKNVFGEQRYKINNLDETVGIRSLCLKFGVASITKVGSTFLVSFKKGSSIDVKKVLEMVAVNKKIRIMPDNSIVLPIEKASSIFESAASAITEYVSKMVAG